jgi:5-methylcytosine-specific restriction enzyme A
MARRKGGAPRLYDLRVWRDRAQPMVLAAHPLCCMCLADGLITPATVVDHITPLTKRPDLGLEVANLQSLCKEHHDARKHAIDVRGFHSEINSQGYFLDANHPSNRSKPGAIERKQGAPDDPVGRQFQTEASEE